MTNEELLSVAEIVERATNRFNAQAAYHRERFDEQVKLIASMKADHEAKMVEHRAAFGARTEAYAQLITKLQNMVREQSNSAKEAGEKLGWTANESAIQAVERVVKERDKLLTQVQDMREEIIRVNEAHGRTKVEHDGLLDELAVQRDAFTANVERIRCEGRDALRAEVAALKSQNPKPQVKVGEWVKRLTPSPMTPAGGVAKVTDVFEVLGLAVKIERPDGVKGTWWAKSCEPCDPPIVKREPTIGDTVRLVTHPEQAQVAKHLRTALQWPWMPSWGLVGQTGKVVKPLVAVAEAVVVALDGSTIFARWPIACLEVVSEANHDTEAGKAVAESAVSETVADEIKVGDVVKVVGASGDLTAQSDIGKIGEVLQLDSMDGAVRLSGGAGWVNHRDVRKVST